MLECINKTKKEILTDYKIAPNATVDRRLHKYFLAAESFRN